MRENADGFSRIGSIYTVPCGQVEYLARSSMEVQRTSVFGDFNGAGSEEERNVCIYIALLLFHLANKTSPKWPQRVEEKQHLARVCCH